MGRMQVGAIVLAGLCALAAVAALAALPAKHAASDKAGAASGAVMQIRDIGHALGPDNPPWPGDEKPFEAVLNASIEKDGYFTRKFTSLEHFGTHVDAPAHFVKGGWTVDQIPVERLYAPAVLIEARKEGRANPDYRMTPEKIYDWERRHGRIPAGAIVLMRTGWADVWPHTVAYRNADGDGVMHFPGFSVEAVKLLIERDVVALGIDTLSVDYGASKDFAVHHLSHEAKLYHIENLAKLDAVPELGARLLVAPINLEGGSGAPARVFMLMQ